MERVGRSTLTLSVVLLVLGLVGTCSALVARADATSTEREAGVTAASAELTAVRFEVATAVLDLATVRAFAGTDAGASPRRLREVEARWALTLGSADADLETLEAGPEARRAGELRAALSRLGPEGPDDLEPFLLQYVNEVLAATLATQSRRDAGTTSPVDAALGPVADLVGYLAFASNQFLGAQQTVGLGGFDDPTVAFVRGAGFVPAAGVQAPSGIRPREVAPPPNLAPPDAEEFLGDLLRADPALGRRVLATVEGPDMAVLDRAAAWAAVTLTSEERTARPVSNATMRGATLAVSADLRADVVGATRSRAAALRAQQREQRARAGLLLGAALGSSALAVLGLGLLLYRRRRRVWALRSAAETDALTGLANRRALEERVAQRFVLPGCHAVVALDLDGFTPVNDAHGQAAGDEVLRAVGSRLRRAVRPGDVVARTGGDEFVVVLLDLDRDVAASLVVATAARVVERLELPVAVGDPVREVQVGVSAGVAVRRGGEDLAATIRQADQDLDAARRSRAAAGRDDVDDLV